MLLNCSLLVNTINGRMQAVILDRFIHFWEASD